MKTLLLFLILSVSTSIYANQYGPPHADQICTDPSPSNETEI